MSNVEFVDEPVEVVATIDKQGQLRPQSVVWRDRRYPIITTGRQWDAENNRLVLVEAADGTRFELQFVRETLTWRMKKIWWGQTLA